MVISECRQSYKERSKKHKRTLGLLNTDVTFFSQVRPMGRRGGEKRRRRRTRKRGEGGVGVDRPGSLGVRDTREVQGGAAADADTAIYLEVL